MRLLLCLMGSITRLTRLPAISYCGSPPPLSCGAEGLGATEDILRFHTYLLYVHWTSPLSCQCVRWSFLRFFFRVPSKIDAQSSGQTPPPPLNLNP
ncbi:uncharacterized protein BO66DRAFT_20349 [Aspergillus aculeatinus CBS 121060]|uniref:Uncharacterized protein n=1 Tax=Aspergillus aculeatinus CBS 121060 TaxID=1448322 RepID=A0ACD1HG46_9EURO|nr:hypothetical protein BO66DRAFT_20349 [Aspergillus aculeatinus CBS 121060]RAH72772.1 hypothetical protein BO66DRAFT_20349 [Aspergillus aculeatinus CBS 121060]